MNGYELCKKLKNDYQTSHIMIILLTAKEKGEKEILAYKSGADLYLNKPFSFELLDQRIWNLIIHNHNLKLKYQTSNDLTPEEFTNSNPDEQFLRKILDLINKNMHKSDLDINFFVDKVGASRSSIYRKMKAITGQSINEFIQNERIKKASKLLLSSNKNISEIAYETGFNDPYYFSRIFRKSKKI
jgi:AraC-like DNA-binding protein